MNKLAVITINHRHGEMIKKAVDSLMAVEADQPFQLFVINNVADEEIKTWLSAAVPGVQVLDNS